MHEESSSSGHAEEVSICSFGSEADFSAKSGAENHHLGKRVTIEVNSQGQE